MFRTLDEFLTRALDWVSNIFGKRRRGICLSLAFVHLCENTRTVQRNHIVRLNSRNHIHICYCFQISCIHTLNIGSRRDLSFLIGRNFHDVIIRSIHSERRWAALHPVSTPWLVNTLSLSLSAFVMHNTRKPSTNTHAYIYIKNNNYKAHTLWHTQIIYIYTHTFSDNTGMYVQLVFCNRRFLSCVEVNSCDAEGWESARKGEEGRVSRFAQIGFWLVIQFSFSFFFYLCVIFVTLK